MKINCIVVEDELMSKRVLEKMILSNNHLHLVQSFDNPVDAVSFLSSNKVDLIFLDIEMPELTGFDVLDSLNEIPNVIITTSKKEYAYQGFQYKVKDFLLKPFTLPKFTKAVSSIIQSEENKSSTESSIYVKVDGVYQHIEFDDILYIQALGDFIKIHTIKKRYVTRSTMSGLENGIPSNLFMRTHRSYIINLSKIEKIEDNAVIINGTLLPVSKIYRVEFFNKINLL